MSDLDYRTWGATKNCKGCRYWSEMLAEVVNGAIKSACINPESKVRGKFMNHGASCDKWESGHWGAVDSPGGNPYEEDDAT